MPKLKSLKDLETLLDELKATAEFVRTEMDSKQEWLDEKSDRFREGAKGEAWQTYLDEVDTFLDSIADLEVPE